MRHRAPRPFVDLCRRLPPGAARRLLAAARNGPVRAVAFLVVVLGLGASGYLASTVGGSSTPPGGSALAPVAPDAGASGPSESPTPSADAVSDVPGTQPEPDGPVAGSTAAGQPTGDATGPVRRALDELTQPPSVTLSAPSATASPGETTQPPSLTTTAPSSSPSLPDVTPTSPLEDLLAPVTTLTAEYPEPDAAVFSLGANEAASFSCSLDGAGYTACDSPMSYTELDPGWHTFAVRATDGSGNVDLTPAESRWHASGGSEDD